MKKYTTIAMALMALMGTSSTRVKGIEPIELNKDNLLRQPQSEGSEEFQKMKHLGITHPLNSRKESDTWKRNRILDSISEDAKNTSELHDRFMHTISIYKKIDAMQSIEKLNQLMNNNSAVVTYVVTYEEVLKKREQAIKKLEQEIKDLEQIKKEQKQASYLTIKDLKMLWNIPSQEKAASERIEPQEYLLPEVLSQEKAASERIEPQE